MTFVKASYKLLAWSLLLLLPVSCSVEKNTSATRLYHGLTAKYNIYFNGNESFKAGLLKISNQYEDDYGDLLKVFEFSDPSTASLCAADMEIAIQKASKLISLKSITARPETKGRESDIETDLLNRKEYNEWVDDSYLLIGKARFYKHEFDEAETVFSYSIREANDPLIRTEATIWLARIYNEAGKYPEAFRLLNELDIPEKAKKSLRAMYYTTLADHFIKQKKYSEAIQPLDIASGLVSGKRQKYRLTYLLAQINGLEGNSLRAIDLYKKVTRMNPPYDVEFNARINIAGVFDVNTGNPADIRKQLEKMLKNSKNKDYLDQIYYALANLSMKEGKEQEAIAYLRKSVASTSGNENQKGRSYLSLANHYFEKNDLMRAGKYYDSTVYFLDQQHPDYQMFKTRSQNLNAVVSQLTIIQTEDSLQKVAAMSENERNKYITSIINEIIQSENEGRPSEYADRFNIGQYYENQMRFQDNIEQEGKWYFYNQSALTFGRTEFRRRYGDRDLENNWRRSNKASVSLSHTDEYNNGPESMDQDTLTAVADYKSPEFYLRNLPLTDSLLAISNDRIANAYLNAGKAYAEKISDPQNASEMFENILKRYPSHSMVPEALYLLYRTNLDGNKALAETYRQRLLEKYPETEYALILSDPDYFKKKQAETREAEELYAKAYGLYTGENYSSALSLCEEGLTKYSQETLAPKFQLLKAYITARISNERDFRGELSTVIKQWPSSEESIRAAEIISFLDQSVPELKIEEDKEIARELFRIDTARTHTFSLIITDPAFDINQAAFDVISYNIDTYTNMNYRTEGTLMGSDFIMINVSGFKNYTEAIEYYHNFNIREHIRNNKEIRMFSFIISDENLTVLNREANPEQYLLFFSDNYLKNIGHR